MFRLYVELKYLVEFIYTGELQVPNEKVIRLLQLSKKYSIRGLKDLTLPSNYIKDTDPNENMELIYIKSLQTLTQQILTKSRTLISRIYLFLVRLQKYRKKMSHIMKKIRSNLKIHSRRDKMIILHCKKMKLS